MGANAQTSVPTFTAGDVLTAANMNISARTGVPVFADTTARDAAFGGTGEKTLAEGQLCYVENLTGVAQLQYYDGAAWVSLTGTGLVYLTGATFTSATSFSLPNSTFTSTYRNYRIIVDATTNTSNSTYTLRWRASGSDNTTGNYFQSSVGINAAGTGVNLAQASATSHTIAIQYGTFPWSLVLDIVDPQQTEKTRAGGVLNYAATDPQVASRNIHLWFDATTAFDSLSIISSVASNMSGNYRVYGYADS